MPPVTRADPAPDRPSAAALAEARRKLSSHQKAEREAAEAVFIAARDEAVPHLIAAVEDRPVVGVSPVPRAALLLGALRARAALPALYGLVERGELSADERPFVARALAEMLEGQDAFDDRCRAALERLAADPDHFTRAFAAQAFGSLGDLRSRSRVQALASDPDPWVREKASSVVSRLAELDALARAEVHPSDFASLVAQAESEGGALKPYLDDLGDPRRAVRDAAVNELVRAGRAAVPWLLDKLNQPAPRARTGAAMALGRLQSTEAAGPLLVAATAPAVSAEERELRTIALRALANSLTGMEEGLASSILPLARDPDRFVRAAALLCLGRLADRAGLRAIVAAIGEDDPFVVESAAVALSEGVREEDVEVVRPLLLALDRRPAPAAAVKEAILIALSRVQIDADALRVRVRHRIRREVWGQTASSRKAAIVLLERLYSEDDPPPLPLLDDILARLGDEHPEVRLVSAAFLRAHLEPGMSHAVPRLEGALQRREAQMSLLVLEAIRRHDTSEARDALERARADANMAARASELLQGFEPRHATWTFTSAGAAAAGVSPAPSRTESQRPASVPRGRVRPASSARSADAVEARFEARTEAPAEARPEDSPAAQSNDHPDERAPLRSAEPDASMEGRRS